LDAKKKEGRRKEAGREYCFFGATFCSGKAGFMWVKRNDLKRNDFPIKAAEPGRHFDASMPMPRSSIFLSVICIKTVACMEKASLEAKYKRKQGNRLLCTESKMNPK